MSMPGFADWLETPQGRYLLDAEQAAIDGIVADVFGYHALQLGLSRLDLLRANRMPFRFRCGAEGAGVSVYAEADALPFASASLDLVVLPHVLEFAARPHHVLREVERVLVPEGSVVLSGFNPLSLWGARRLLARETSAMPWRGRYRTLMRIKDWLALLGIEVQTAGCAAWAPPVRSPRWLERWRFIDRAGPRWWPIGGAVYVVHGIKRVHGMRLITPQWRERGARAGRLSALTQRNGGTRKSE